ncbi:hypothetical protein BH10PSE7_BH10PSE7_31730 [soil metagenome]
MESYLKLNRTRPNFWFGVFFMVLSALLFTQTFGLAPSLVPNSIGSAFFPRLLLIAIFVLGIALTRQKAGSGELSESEEPYESFRPPLLLFAVMWVFIISVPFIGYYLANIIMISGALYIFGERRLWLHAVTVAGIEIFTYAIFDRTFGVLFPNPAFIQGILSSWT